MKKSFLTFGTALLALSLLLYNCSEGDQAAIGPDTGNTITPDIKENFAILGFDVSDIRTENHFDPLTETEKEYYLLENDILISHEQMLEMLANENAPTTEQYRTSNLVNVPGTSRAIRILGFVSGSSSATLDAKMRAALQDAVANYNNLDLNLNFFLTFGNNTAGKDIVVRREVGAAGGRAGFPSGGNPFASVFIRSLTSTNFSQNVVEHVLTHEIGHCIGFRHTDFFNRSISCGSGGNEGPAGVGAIHIPGTPGTSNIDLNSVMLACFNANETGEFSNFDITALEDLYGTSTGGGGDPSLTVSRTNVGFGTSGGSTTVNITSNVNWTVSENAYWLRVTPTSGSNNGSITIRAGRQVLCEPQRFARVVVNGGAAGNKTINVSQAGSFPPPPGIQCP